MDKYVPYIVENDVVLLECVRELYVTHDEGTIALDWVKLLRGMIFLDSRMCDFLTRKFLVGRWLSRLITTVIDLEICL